MNQTVYPFGTDGSLPSSIGLVNDLETGGTDKALTAEQGKELGTFLFGKTENVSLSGLTISDYSLGSNDWGGIRGTHMVLPVVSGKRYVLEVTASSGTGGWYGLLTDEYTVPSDSSDSVPYVSGTGREWIYTGSSVEILIPDSCAYICMCPKDGSANTATWKVTEKYNDYENTFLDKIGEIDEVREATYTYLLTPIDISGSAVQSCSLGSTQWYFSSSNKPTHIAVPVSGMSEVQIKLVSCAGSTSYYTFVTSSYSPPVSNGANIPFATGISQRSSIAVTKEASLAVPQDAAYLILTTRDGGGNNATWTVWERESLTVDEAIRERCVHVGDPISIDAGVPVKIKVVSWNIGGFSLGNSGDSSITPSIFDEMRSKWRIAVDGLGADVLCCCEYNTNFMDAQGGSEAVTARDAVFTEDVFAYAKIGPEVAANSYMQTAIFANLNLESSTAVPFQNTVQQGRYYQVSETHMAGKLVKIVEVHLDFSNTDAVDDSSRLVRRQQINQLISTFANDDYVIICGDYNINKWEHRSDYDLFTEAGYKMLNYNSYLGSIRTYPAGNQNDGGILDNIIYKGFVSSRRGLLDDATLSDHKALYADLTMVPTIETSDDNGSNDSDSITQS